jgi:energy-converting hydrogenase B subunit D
VTAIIGVVLTLVLLGGTAVVLTEKPTRQAIMLSAYGVLLGILFLSLSAPDVALSQIGVGTAIVPLVVMLAIKRIQARP